MTHVDEATTGVVAPTLSIVMVTYSRDGIVQQSIQQAATATQGRSDIEFILVDNNPDQIDRTPFCAPFARHRVVKIGANKGVSSRNDGAFAAEGDYILFLDDDAFLTPVGAVDLYLAAFAANPKAAIVGARHIDHDTGKTPNQSFPHTDKSLPKDQQFKTFRFQGNGFCLKRSAFQDIGPMSTDFFYGLEEIDYAYRVIEAGYEIIYEPKCQMIEHNDPGGRLPARRVQEMRLTNKFIISHKYMPLIYLPVNFVLFTAFVFYLNRGRINIVRSFYDYVVWARKNPGSRKPISAAAQAYIRDCGGVIWK